MIKSAVKKILAEIAYSLRRFTDTLGITKPTMKVMSVDETLDELINTEKSLVRFGDGELTVIRGRGIEFQNVNEELRQDLIDVIGYQYDNLMVSIQDIFEGLSMYVPKSQFFWKDHLLFYRSYYKKYCNPNRIYASTSFSRAYITIADKSQSVRWFEKAKKIWQDKDVVIVEGVTTHNGAGNDLFDGCKSVRRIICPPTNAYERLSEIKAECMKMPKDMLFLVTLGPAAKPLVRDLFLEGYRVIDIGQIDSEYDMFLAKATEKISFEKGKVISIEDNRKMGFDKYLDEIIVRIE